MRRIVFDFIWLALTLAAALSLLAQVLPVFGGANAIVAVFVATLVSGHLHGRRIASRVAPAYAWKVASVLVLLLFGVGCLGLWFDPAAQARNAGVPPRDVALPVIVVAGLVLVSLRVLFRWGAVQGAKSVGAPFSPEGETSTSGR